MARRQRRRRLPEPRQVTIESMSHEGRGIAHVNGKTVFVFGALQDETVRIQVLKTNRNFDQATTIEVIEPSPKRISPRCEAFQVCGGCSLQHLDNVPPLRADAWGYRRKARLGVKHVSKKGRVLVGFRERNTPFIADMRRCEVLLPEVGHKLEQLSDLIGQLEARAQIPQIEVAADADRVQLVFRHMQPLSEHDRALLLEFAEVHDFHIMLQPGGPDSVQALSPGPSELCLQPTGADDIRIAFNALDFVQVNSPINRQMVAQALEFCSRSIACWTCSADSEILPCRWRNAASG